MRSAGTPTARLVVLRIYCGLLRRHVDWRWAGAAVHHCTRLHRARHSLMGDELTVLIGRAFQRRAVLPPTYTAGLEVGGGRRHAPPTLAQFGWAAFLLSLMQAWIRTSLDGRFYLHHGVPQKFHTRRAAGTSCRGRAGVMRHWGFVFLVSKRFGRSP